MSDKDCSCFVNLLKVIDVLQKNAECCSDCNSGCDRPFLGTVANTICFNTRPVTFYKCDGTLLTLNIEDSDGGPTTTSVFRVEDVDGCCVKVSLLIPNTDTTDVFRAYIPTGEFATINLSCVCAIACLPDIVIDSI